MCGKKHESEMDVDFVLELEPVEIQRRIEDGEDGWSLQINDGSLDVYCSEKCANNQTP